LKYLATQFWDGVSVCEMKKQVETYKSLASGRHSDGATVIFRRAQVDHVRVGDVSPQS
jgi:hypothetical protein